MNTSKGIPFLPEQASSLAGGMDSLYFFLIGLSIFFLVLIGGLTTYFLIRYRRRSDTDRPAELHGNVVLELVWSIIPLMLTMVLFFWGAWLFYQNFRSPPDSMEILVTGKQWMWKLQHPSGKSEINNLHVPMGQPIKLTMTSEDVIHSMYIPAFRVKADVLPGRYTSVWFKPIKLGQYHLFCAEYCGTEHSVMGGWVTVVTPSEYERWASGEAGQSLTQSPIQAGQQLFTELGCMTCHQPDSTALGPNLTGLFGHEVKLADGTTVIADEDYIRESILYPQAKTVAGFQPIMPTFRGLVNETQLIQIIAYIKSLGGQEGSGVQP